jgi:hypothetical protein
MTFAWTPPDLSPGSTWTQERVRNLLSAALMYKEPGPLIEEGLVMLR